MNRLFSLIKIVFIIFIFLVITSIIYILISSSYWKLELTNKTNNDVVFKSKYCPHSDNELFVGKNSTKSFYCFDSELICKEWAKKICVKSLGCSTFWHTAHCSGHLGSFLESVTDIKISTSDLTYESQPETNGKK